MHGPFEFTCRSRQTASSAKLLNIRGSESSLKTKKLVDRDGQHLSRFSHDPARTLQMTT